MGEINPALMDYRSKPPSPHPHTLTHPHPHTLTPSPGAQLLDIITKATSGTPLTSHTTHTLTTDDAGFQDPNLCGVRVKAEGSSSPATTSTDPPNKRTSSSRGLLYLHL